MSVDILMVVSIVLVVVAFLLTLADWWQERRHRARQLRVLSAGWYGITPSPGESDERLRERVRDSLRRL